MLGFESLVVRVGGFTLTADFAVRPGVITAVIGPSGSGKSTLLGAAAGFLPLAQGAIRLDGEDISALAPGRRPISIVFQDGNLFPHLDVATNVALGRDPAGRMTSDLKREVAAVLERVGLGGLEGRMPSELSGGQQSRAALARVLLRDKPVVLLDEPFAALGPALRREMLHLVADVLGDRTVLMVTHAPEDARAVAPDTVFVERGRVHPPVETEALLADPPEGLRDYLG